MAADLRAHWRLDGKLALVTGGTLGIGLAVVEELCALGARVLIAARDGGRLDATVRRLEEAGYRAHGVACDVASTADRARAVALVDQCGGVLHALVNNAGTNLRKPAVDYSESEVEALIRTNLLSAFELSRALHGQLTAAGDGRVVNVGSVAGIVSTRTGVPYGMTKAAMAQMARNLAIEWGEDGILVNTVAPWYTRTPLAEQVLIDDAFRRRVVDRTPLRRIAEPEEIARVVAFLCLPAASYVSGQCLAVDGGFTANGFEP